MQRGSGRRPGARGDAAPGLTDPRGVCSRFLGHRLGGKYPRRRMDAWRHRAGRSCVRWIHLARILRPFPQLRRFGKKSIDLESANQL